MLLTKHIMDTSTPQDSPSVLSDEPHAANTEQSEAALLEAFQAADDSEMSTEDFTRLFVKSIRLEPGEEFETRLDMFTEKDRNKMKKFIAGDDPERLTEGGYQVPIGIMLPERTYRGSKDGKVMAGEEFGLSWLWPFKSGDEKKPKAKVPEEYHSFIDVKSTGTEYVSDEPFSNWGGTVSTVPPHTFTPLDVKGVQAVVKLARKENKRIRVAGFRHTWSNMYATDDGIVISLINLSLAQSGSYSVHQHASKGGFELTAQEKKPPSMSFNDIELGKFVPNTNKTKILARVGAGITNERFRMWALESGWTLPLNVIMVEITAGGANAPICHGAGINNKTLSDLVRKIEYVDANGEFQFIDDIEELKAAAGAFGLLGIITHLTFELDKMTYADMKPAKLKNVLAIPPPAKYKAPDGYPTPKEVYSITEDQRQIAERDFIKKAHSYYAEWFWYAYRETTWVNCWDTTKDSKGSQKEYPSYSQVFLQVIGTMAVDAANASFLKTLKPHVQASANAMVALRYMPTDSVKTPLINALHFQRAIQHFKVLCVEVMIPIPPLSSDRSKPDWSVVQRAWWDAISISLDDQYKTGALRVCLELRITAGSDIIMAPQGGAPFGTASIEVITTPAAGEDGSWAPYVQKLLDQWTSYKDCDGKTKLKVRPHWAKQWENFTVKNKDNQDVPWQEHLKKESYANEIPKFKETLAGIGRKHGWTLEDIKNRFSNKLLDDLYFK